MTIRSCPGSSDSAIHPEGWTVCNVCVARGRSRGRLYVFQRSGALVWTEVHRRHAQLVADLTGVAIENDQLLQEARRHERVDRQLSIGAEIQAQLLPDHCPVIEGVGSCSALSSCVSGWW